MKKRNRLRTLLMAGVAALAVAAGLAGYAGKAFDGFEQDTVDARFSVRGDQKAPPNLVVVGIDETTLHDINVKWPYPRQFHAKVIDRLAADGAKVIAFDIVFAEPDRGRKVLCDFAGVDLTRGDCALVEATANAGNLVYSAVEVGDKGSVRFVGQDDPGVLPALDARAGFTGTADAGDGVQRHFLYGFSGLKGFAPAIVERETGKKVPRSDFDDKGEAWIDYYGGPGSIPEVSYSKVMRGQMPKGYFKGKTVIVGATDASLKDIFFTSTTGSEPMSGPELQAHAVGTVRRGNPLRDIPGGWNVLAIVLLGLVVPAGAIPLRMRGLLVGVAAAAAFLVFAQLMFNGDRIVAVIYPLGALILASLGALLVQYFTETRERRRTRALFARFVPENVVDQVLDRTDDDLRLGGVEREGTVMFSDLRGFTSFAESLPVTRVIEVLNRYLGEMSEAILDHGGTLVAYMGDGIMAVFGAPLVQDDHADRGLAAAREMLGPRLTAFNQYLIDEGLHETGFRMGVGLNSGPVMSGNVGSERRLEYTAIGDTTNTAARLEGMTKGTPHMLFVAESTREMLRTPVDELFFVDEFEVRGREAKIRLWSLPEASDAAPVGAEGGQRKVDGD
jgi:adenylate cyclase